MTTEESRTASRDLASRVNFVAENNSSTALSVTDLPPTRQPPRFQLKSAGFNNPADLQKPLMYFIAPGPLLIPTNEPIIVKSLITNDLIEKDDPPPYQQHDFDIVKFGISSNAMQRKRTHDHDFGECTLMDYITCDNTEELEKMAKCWFVAMNRLISAKSAKKNSQDTELVRPTTQEEYIYIVSKIYEMAQRCDSMAVSDELRIEMEKTAQKKEETAQEHAKISQLQLQLELKKLEFQMQLNNLEKTNTRVVGREAPAEVEQEQLEPTESDEMVSSETPSVEIPEAVDIQNSERSGSGNLNIVQINTPSATSMSQKITSNVVLQCILSDTNQVARIDKLVALVDQTSTSSAVSGFSTEALVALIIAIAIVCCSCSFAAKKYIDNK